MITPIAVVWVLLWAPVVPHAKTQIEDIYPTQQACEMAKAAIEHGPGASFSCVSYRPITPNYGNQ